MAFSSNYNKNEKIYSQHLDEVKGIKFTRREVDIIACILHNRGEKKIASLFMLSPRTINSHVYNIMNKIGCNAKDQIIDFAETSGKLGFFREYYLHLLGKSYFEKFLLKVRATINRNKVYCFCTKEDILGNSNPLYQSIQKHLSIANIEIVELGTQEYKKLEEKILPQIELKNISEQSYYENITSEMCKIINSEELRKLAAEFNDIYKRLLDKSSQESIPNDRLRNKVNKKFIVFFFFFISIVFSLASYISFIKLEDGKIESLQQPQIIKDLEIFLSELQSKGYTANNIDKSKASINQSILKKVEKILDYKNSVKLNYFFNKAEIESKLLINYVYNLHALSSYYMFNMHEGKESQKILLYAKRLIENYVNARSSIKTNFDNLNHEEILSELSIVSDLPEIYTRIIYSLGRTYIYNGSSKGGTKYFELSKYLGNKLGLLEGYLSDISGLLIIMKDESLRENSEKITENLLKILSRYKELSEDTKEYISDYNPMLKTQERIIPASNSYNKFFCYLKQLEIYRDLLSVEQNDKKIGQYIKNINSLFEKNSDENLIYLKDKVSLKKQAGLYNCLGEIFFILAKKFPEILKQSSAIASFIGCKYGAQIESKNLALILSEVSFMNARDISRNTDFTKAEAYNGLAKIYKLLLELNISNFNNDKKEILIRKIEDYNVKSQEINDVLRIKMH